MTRLDIACVVVAWICLVVAAAAGARLASANHLAEMLARHCSWLERRVHELEDGAERAASGERVTL